MFFGAKLQAESHDKQLQRYVKNANSLEANKRKARVAAKNKWTSNKILSYQKIRCPKQER